MEIIKNNNIEKIKALAQKQREIKRTIRKEKRIWYKKILGE
jgi:hypothetical protein